MINNVLLRDRNILIVVVGWLLHCLIISRLTFIVHRLLFALEEFIVVVEYVIVDSLLNSLNGKFVDFITAVFNFVIGCSGFSLLLLLKLLLNSLLLFLFPVGIEQSPLERLEGIKEASLSIDCLLILQHLFIDIGDCSQFMNVDLDLILVILHDSKY